MVIERSKNSKRNITLGLINRAVAIIIPFVTRTVLLKTLGSQYLGLNGLFVSILQVLNISELGFSSAVVFVLYNPVARDEYETIRGILSYLKRIYRYIGVTETVLGIVIMPFLPFFIKGSYPKEINIYAVFGIYIANSVAGYFFGGYRFTILNSIQRNDIVLALQSVIQIITGSAQITILLLSKNYYLYLVIIPVLTVFNNFIILELTKKKYPYFYPSGAIDLENKKKINKRVKGLMVDKMCQTSRNSIDNICISSFLGLTMTAVYNNYYYVVASLIAVSNVFTSSLLAGIGNSIVVESKDKNYEDMKKINYIYMTYASIATICLTMLIQPFMRIWVGVELTYNDNFVWILAAYFYALNMGNIRALYSDAAGLWWENRWRALIEAIANLILNFIFVQLMGLFGIVLASFLTVIIINFGFGSSIIFKYYFKNMRYVEYILISIKLSFVTFAGCVIVSRIIGLFNIVNDLLCLVISGIVCISAGTIVVVGVNMVNPSYRDAILWLKRKLGS